MFDIIAIDWGEIRTGIALVSSQTSLVLPYQEEVFTKNLEEILAKIILDKKTKTLVIGKPTNFELQDTETTKSIDKFVKVLEESYTELEIVFVNENGSSKISKNTLTSIRITGGSSIIRKPFKESKISQFSKHTVNHLAAVEIANRFLNSKTSD
jgi:RNase H-fold protein (predicted Holliday junction resolvase)